VAAWAKVMDLDRFDLTMMASADGGSQGTGR